MKYTDKSQHQTFNERVTNSDIKQIGESYEIDINTKKQKTPLWKKIAVGVIIAVIASVIGYFIQTLL